jgi:hypothetical protein
MRQNFYRGFVRSIWLLLGGAWGAWLGFGGYFRLPHNTNGFGTFVASGYFVVFAALGFLAGAASAALFGGLTEWFLRRCGQAGAAALSVATLATALLLWQISDVVQARYPGLRASAVTQPQRNTPAAAIRPVDKMSHPNPCSNPRPTEARDRASWDAECR